MPTEQPKANLSLIKNNTEQYTDSNNYGGKIEVRKMPSIPPALPLLPKSQIVIEPIRTGAPISFIKLAFGNGACSGFTEKQGSQNLKEDADYKELEFLLLKKPKRNFKTMFSVELNNYDRNPIVYSRYATGTYDPDEKVQENCFKSWIWEIEKIKAPAPGMKVIK